MTTPIREKRSSARRSTPTPAKVTDLPVEAPPTDAAFQHFTKFLALYNDKSWELATIQAQIEGAVLRVVEMHRDRFADLQQGLLWAGEMVEALARENPQWFGAGKTLRTPYGTVKFTAATRVMITTNETAVITAVEQIHDEGQGVPNPFLRRRVELNLEALAGLPEDILRDLGLARVTDDRFSFKPLRVDVGKVAGELRPGKEGA